ncbi:MAG: PEP-CTERM-box response regulator transcription factor [Alphaproteobacteria bacterium]
MTSQSRPDDRGQAGTREKLLLVDDDPGILRQLAWSFPDHEVLIAADRETAIERVKEHAPKVVSLDLGLPPDPDGSTVGLDILEKILAIHPRTKVIVVSGSEDREDAVQAVARGAWDFFQKPIDAEALGFIVKRAFHVARLEAENQRLKSASGQALPGLITANPAMLEVCRTVERIAPTSVNVLILGESGTGKELLARAVHDKSPRRDQPFVAINCAAIPDTLLESELFGYEKGAFTGATRQVKGKIETAHRGTLFLDEIGDMPFNLQAKLLRFVEERRIERLGGRSQIEVDVRIVSATHQPLMQRVDEDLFRQDLLYRLAGMTVEIPPLSARGDDVLLLAQHFVETFANEHGRQAARLAEDAKRVLMAHRWPGNIRELANTVQRAVILAEGRSIKASDLSLDGKRDQAGPAPAGSPALLSAEFISLRDARDHAERQAVDAAVRKSAGNLSTAAKLLGISRPTLYSLLRRHEDLLPSGSTEA